MLEKLFKLYFVYTVYEQWYISQSDFEYYLFSEISEEWRCIFSSLSCMLSCMLSTCTAGAHSLSFSVFSGSGSNSCVETS